RETGERRLPLHRFRRLQTKGGVAWVGRRNDGRKNLRDELPQKDEEQPQAEAHEGGGGCGTEYDREQEGKGEPYARVRDRDQKEDECARGLLRIRRHAEDQQPEPDHQQPERDQADRDRKQAGAKLSEQERVAIDGLRQHARKRAPGVLAIDRIKRKANRHHRHKESAQEKQEGKRNVLARIRKQAQERERILWGGIADLLGGEIDGHESQDDDQTFDHAHTHAGEVIACLLENNNSQTIQCGAFTWHESRSPEDGHGSNGYRWPQGSALRRRDAGDGRRRLRTNVVIGEQQQLRWREAFDLLHAGYGGEVLGEILPLRFDLDTETAAQNLAAELGHGPHENDRAFTKESHPVADALHAF